MARRMLLLRLAAVSVLLVSCTSGESILPPDTETPTAEQLTVRINPDTDTLLVGTARTLAVAVTNQFGQARSLPVSWTSLTPAIASVSSIGEVTGLAAGEARILANAGTAADTATVTVLPVISTATIVPNAVEVLLGDSIQFSANFGNVNSRVYGTPEWTSTDSSVAVIRPDGQLVSVGPGEATIKVSLGSVSATASARIFRAPVVSVTVSPAVSSLSPGQSVQLNAVGYDLFRRVVPDVDVEWTSSNPVAATVTSAGRVTAVSRGFASVTARIEGRRASATINVGPKPVQSVSVALTSPEVVEGGTITASASPRDASGAAVDDVPIAWQSSNPTVATVNSSGVIVGMLEGTTTISAISGGQVGSTALRVSRRTPTSLSITPSAPSINVGQQTQLAIDVLDQTGRKIQSAPLSLTSSNPAIATISSSGVLGGVAVGTSTITARSGTLSATAIATVSAVPVARVTVSPATLSLIEGGSGVLSAIALDGTGATLTGRPISWASSNPTVASVNAVGAVTALSAGTATITATSEGKIATAGVTVAARPPAPVSTVSVTLNSGSLLPSEQTQAIATLRDANGGILTGRSVVWSTSDPDLAVVSSSGLVTARNAGTVSIFAESEGKRGVAALVVQQGALAPVAMIEFTLNSSSIAAGQTTGSSVVLRDAANNILYGRTVSYTSLAPTIATASSGGIISGLAVGSARIMAASGTARDTTSLTVGTATTPTPVLTSILVSAPATSVQVGMSLQHTATGRDQVGQPIATGTLTWASSSPSIATVNSSGLVSGVSVGSVTISATASNGTRGTYALSVSSATPTTPTVATVSVSLSPTSVTAGQTAQATTVLRDGSGNVITGQTVSYSSSNTSVATVGTSGVVNSLAAGTAVITAVSGTKSGSATLTVTAPAPPPPPPPPPTGTPVPLAELPRLWVNSAYVPPTGKTITVNAGGDLQAAIYSAQRGDVIMLQPGATFKGDFVLPNKPGTGWITIRSAAPDANLPAQGQRITPAYAAQLPKLVSNTSTVISTHAGARFYRLMFLEVTLAAGQSSLNSLIRLGDPNGDQTTNMASDLVIDRSYIHGTDTAELVRCVLLSSAWTAVVDSHLSDCHATGFDSQAIVGWNGRGPYKINNNYLQGAGEIVMWGGAVPGTPGLIPSDIEMRGNHLHKPAAWKSKTWSIKNIFEVKFGRRILFEGNVLDGNWQQAQTGYAINVKTSAPPPMTWGVTEDVTIRGNLIRNVGAGIVLLAYEGASTLPANRVTITDNVMTNVNTGIYNGSGNMFTVLAGVKNVTIEHNTTVTSGTLNNAVAFDTPAGASLAFRNNIISRGEYGVKGSGAAEGTATLSMFAPGYDFRANLFIRTTSNTYPTSTWFAGTTADVGFVDYSGGNYALSASSPYKGKGTSGRDLGADISLVNSLTARAVVP